MTRLPNPKFDFGTTVYPVLCPSKENAGMVTGYILRPGGHILYLVSDESGTESEREAIELTDEVDYTASSDKDDK
jgi:hypothetical protein